MYSNKCVIQIGSHVGNTTNDPIFNQIDNTTKLIVVEPVPYLFHQLVKNYSSRTSNVIFINKAVSNSVGEIELTIPSEKNNFAVLPPWATQLSSVNPTHATLHLPTLLVETITVPTTTIDAIIDEHEIRDIELLHTDTEGHDHTILMNYSFRIKPRQVLFEHAHIDGLFTVGKNYKELSDRLCSLGYVKRFQTVEDTMFEYVSM
jgi:FkbM family methyltransferase